MDLRDSPSEAQFRAELRAFLGDTVPQMGPQPDWGKDMRGMRDYNARWQRLLYDAGYAGLNWPAEFGGRGATLTEQLIFHEEATRAGAPYNGTNFVGLNHGGPTLIVEGSDAQKKAHLPRILRGEEVWCQCFSEPGAGSDLAALRTRAVREGDEYVVHGHKIWTSMATVADYAELLVRTDPDAPKHKGITWLILPMDQPGIEIRPLRTLFGGSEFCEVFLDGARVPVANRVGDENDGWRVTNVTLRFERGTAFAGAIASMQRVLDTLVRGAAHARREDASAWDDRGVRRELGHAQAELDALLAMLKLSIAQASRTGVPGLGSSALKLMHTELWQRMGDLAMRLVGRAGLTRADFEDLPGERAAFAMLGSIQSSIAAGTSQIQRNIIAERILGQPKDR